MHFMPGHHLWQMWCRIPTKMSQEVLLQGRSREPSFPPFSSLFPGAGGVRINLRWDLMNAGWPQTCHGSETNLVSVPPSPCAGDSRQESPCPSLGSLAHHAWCFPTFQWSDQQLSTTEPVEAFSRDAVVWKENSVQNWDTLIFKVRGTHYACFS